MKVQVDEVGEFTGSEITFLYPGITHGLKGTWNKGNIVKAKGVKVGVPAREDCHNCEF